MLFEEFFHQGDREREQDMKISYLMDRFTVNIAQSQLGFIDFIVQPTFRAMTDLMPNLEEYNLANLDINKEKWRELIPEYEIKMKN